MHDSLPSNALILSFDFWVFCSIDRQRVYPQGIPNNCAPGQLVCFDHWVQKSQNPFIFLFGHIRSVDSYLCSFFGEGVFGELAEKSLTLLGSIIVASAHYKNYKACKELDCA